MVLPQDDPIALASEAAKLLKRLPHMVLGTADVDGQPWTVPVHQTTLSNGTITWRSMTDARHSENIAQNPKVSAAMYDLADGGEVSIFLEGTAQLDSQAGSDPRRTYVMTISGVWMNDDTHTKVRVDLDKLKDQLKN